MRKLFTSLVNVSEGRNPNIIRALENSISLGHAAVDTCRSVALLNRFTDLDYNRSVFTVAGERDALRKAVLSLCGTALDLIDLRSHEGIHPRGGVIDLVPVHPLLNTTLDEAADIAREISASLTEKGNPCFLYGAADESGRSLVQRRKEHGWFKSKGVEGSAATGWTAVGATPYVLNCNVTLDTDDVAMGREIAAAVRRKGAVESMAFPHEGKVEIACNMTNLEAISPEELVTQVKSLGVSRGIGIVDKTIIGYTPEKLAELTQEVLYGEDQN